MRGWAKILGAILLLFGLAVGAGTASLHFSMEQKGTPERERFYQTLGGALGSVLLVGIGSLLLVWSQRRPASISPTPQGQTSKSIASAKVPAPLVSGIICLMLGVAGGVVLSAFVDFGLSKQLAANPENGGNPELKDVSTKGGPPGAGGGGGKGGPPGGGGGGGKGGGGKGGGGKGGFGPSPKAQLTQLVAKLDTLTKKPLKVELNPEQKKQISAVLADLDAKDEMTDDEARAKLEALLKIVEPSRETLDSAGFRWPGGPNQPVTDLPNPFKGGDNGERLKSLRESTK